MYLFKFSLKVSQQLILISCLSLLLLSVVTNLAVSKQFNKILSSTVIEQQYKNVGLAAEILSKNMQEFELSRDMTGGVEKLYFNEMPSFEDHTLIDHIGELTGETVTIFLWDTESRDFWRKTTNIKKNNGSRAVGTPLGKKGAVYPYMIDGERYVGRANILGVDYYTLYEPIYKTGSRSVVGILYVGIKAQQFDDTRHEIITTLMLIAVVVTLLVMGALIFFFHYKFSVLFKRVNQQMRVLSEGEKGIEIVGAERKDEFGDMARSLEAFQKNAYEIERLEEEQKRQEEEQKQRRHEEMMAMAGSFEEQVGSIVEALEAAAHDMQDMATTMAAAVEEMSCQSSSVASASQEASSNVQTVAAASKQLLQSISAISIEVNDTAGTAQTCAQTAEGSQKNLHDLQRAVDEIDGVIQSINEVAEQTNLLALNATIEAARAGDAGKGFAVVASEVKSLANETHKMTEEISKKVEHIKGSASSTINDVQDIISQITAVDTKTASISAAIDEQSSSTEEISENVLQAAEGTNEVSRNIEGVQQAANESADSTEKLRVASDELAQHATKLKGAVSSFLEGVRTS